VQSATAADEEGKPKQHPWRKDAKIGGHRKHDRNQKKQNLRGQHDAASVEIIGKRASRNRENHHRQRCRGLNQRDHIIGARNGGHHPARADCLHETAKI
jgi:hypothetical protein